MPARRWQFSYARLLPAKRFAGSETAGPISLAVSVNSLRPYLTSSIDLCVVPTLTFGCLSAFLVVSHGRRRLLWFAVIYAPRGETSGYLSFPLRALATVPGRPMLGGSARNVEAEAALRAATRADPTFADAWYNLSDLLDEQGRVEAAIKCLRTTLRVAPDYVDALFNLALLLQRTNQYAEAADYWRRYLASDYQSE